MKRMTKLFGVLAALALCLGTASAAVTNTAYNQVRNLGGTAGVNFTSDTIVAIPLSASYTPNFTVATGQKFISDVTTYEVTTCGGARLTLASKTWTENASTYVFKSASPLTWTASGCTLNVKYVAFAKSTGTDSTSPLLFLVNLDNTSGSSALSATAGGTITVTMDATNGWLYF